MTLKEKLLKKSNLWHLAAVGIFLSISCIYFYPALQGYAVNQGDVKNWVGAAQEIASYQKEGQQIGWTNSMFSGMPATQISMIYEGRQIPDFFRGALSLWLPTPISLLFVYFLSFYILTISFKVKPLVGIVGAIAYGLSSYFIIIIEAGHVTKALAVGYAPLLIAGFIFAYRWKNWMLGVALSALFMTFQLTANHLQITYYLVFVLIGLGIVELIRYVKMEGGIMKFLKITGGLFVAYFVAILVNYGNLKGTSEYTEATTRGGTELTIKSDGTPNEDIKTSGLDRDYITAWSYGKAETFSFIVPNFKGGETGEIGKNPDNDKALKEADNMYRPNIKQNNQYWGDQPFTSGPVYIGIIVFLLALLSLYYSNDKSKWALLAVTIVTVMLSWGKNFMGLTDFFLDFLPGYNKFRAVTIILVIAEICLPLLGVLFLHKLYKAKEDVVKNIKPFLIISGSLVFLLLIFIGIPSAFNTFLSDAELAQIEQIPVEQADAAGDYFSQLEAVRISIFRSDVWRSMFFLVLAIGTIFAYVKDLFNKKIFLINIGALILIDLIMVDMRYIATEKTGKNFKQWIEVYKQKYPYTAGEGEKQILDFEMAENPSLASKLDSTMGVLQNEFKDQDLTANEKQRIIDWSIYRTMNRYTNFRVLEEGNAFNSSYVAYFNKSIGGYHGAKLGRYQDLIEFHLSQNNPAVFDMLNMKYTIRPQYDAQGNIVNSSLTNINSTALGNAWLSKDIKMVKNADEEIMALQSSKTFKMQSFGGHSLIVNGVVDTFATVVQSDNLALLLSTGVDSAGNVSKDTIPLQVPFQAVTKDLPLAYVLSDQGVNWDYAMNVDSSKVPLLGLQVGGRSGWDPEQVTIVDERYSANLSQKTYSGNGEVKMTSYHPDVITYSFSSAEKQFMVFSEIYYPVGWKAYVDNEEVPISCVNYLLRGIEVPAGEHKVELVYKLDSYSTAGTLAWVGSILILILIAGGIYFETKIKDDALANEESTLA